MKNIFRHTLLFSAILTVMCTIHALHAQKRIPRPTELTGVFIPSSADGTIGGKIRLAWKWTGEAPAQNYTPFYIHRSTESAPPFPIIGVTMAQEFVDVGFPTSDTTYHYYVTKLDLDSSFSEPSNIVDVDVPAFQRIAIKSEPHNLGYVGQQYIYEVVAVSSIPNDEIRYSLISSPASAIPQGMWINEKSGRLEWLPQTEGLFGVTVVAESKSGQRAEQSFQLCIRETFERGELHGHVTDKLGNPIPNISVHAYFISADSASSVNCFGVVDAIPFAVTNADGLYAIENVRAGEYIIMASSHSNEYSAVWWEQAQSQRDAKKFLLKKNQKNPANFILQKNSPATLVRLCGSVRTESVVGISKATVTAIPIDPISNLPLRTRGGSEFKTTTDTDGSYCLRVPSNTPFLLYASSPGFVSEFYFNKTSLLEADRLSLSSDWNGFDLRLKSRSTQTRSISGKVSDRRTGIESWILMYAISSSGIKPIESIPTDAEGNYRCDNITEEHLLIQAIPFDYKKWSSAYFSASPLIVDRWKDAKTFKVQGENSNINVYLSEIHESGIGIAEGQLVDQMNKPLAGAIVSATDEKGNILCLAVTTYSGNFKMDGVPEGPFLVTTDKVGYEQSTNASAYINYNSSREAKGIFIRSVVVRVSNVLDQSLPLVPSLEQNYPNPVSHNLNQEQTVIEFSLPSSQYVRLVLHDVLGREIAHIAEGMFETGRYKKEVSTLNLPAGVYFYTLQTSAVVLTKKLMVTK